MLQATLILHLRQRIPKGQNLADVLATVLNLGKNAVYKRIEGVTPFSIDDLAALAAHFDLPWQAIFQADRPAVLIEFSGFNTPVSCLTYLQTIERDALALRSTPAPYVWYVTTGLPDFHYYQFEELTLFNLFIWERIVWNKPEWQGRKFSLTWFPHKEVLLPLAKRLANHYSLIPATEIWNEYVLDNLLRQLVYVCESHLFDDPEDLLLICRQMRVLVQHLEAMAQSGRRYPPGGTAAEAAAPYRLFNHETMQNNIMLLVETGVSEHIYSVLDNPNFLKTDSPELVHHTRKLFEKLLQRAIPLGEGGERYRHRFFEKLERKITLYEQKIISLLEGNRTVPEVV